MASALARLVKPMVEWCAGRYQANLAVSLKKYGLRYDDLYDPRMDLDVEEALRRLPAQELLDRNARLKRAMDLSLKGTFLPKELQEVQTPLDFYLKPYLDEVKAERSERARLGTGAPYQRTIP
jgi:ubiquinol-cytochrome c reductase subunit 7